MLFKVGFLSLLDENDALTYERVSSRPRLQICTNFAPRYKHGEYHFRQGWQGPSDRLGVGEAGGRSWQ